MVMVPLTAVEGLFGHQNEVEVRPRLDAEYSALHAEILRRAEAIASPDDAGSVAGNPVATAAAALLRDFANEAESPCVIRVGRDIDPWDERLRHLREMVAMTPELLFATGSEEAGLSSDDPRIERLKLVSDQIGALVSETLEASIEAVEPENASSPSAGFHPTI